MSCLIPDPFVLGHSLRTIWLYAGRDDLVSAPAVAALAAGSLRISPMVVLELEYLQAVGRLSVGGEEIATALAAERNIQRDSQPFGAIVRAALAQTWTRDPFDRLIAGHAVSAGGTLVTKDETMREHVLSSIW